jgi:hypothetical protein
MQGVVCAQDTAVSRSLASIGSSHANIYTLNFLFLFFFFLSLFLEATKEMMGVSFHSRT